VDKSKIVAFSLGDAMKLKG